jgi:hypothetical protein
MKERYKCVVTIQNESMTFKRYGETETEVRGELESFIREAYDSPCQVISIEKDKTHPVKAKKEKANA